MKKINDHLDPENPAHAVVIAINERNESIYGEWHEECGTFERYCRCERKEKKTQTI